MITHAFVQYCFDSEEHSVSVRPHGNSKKKEKFLRIDQEAENRQYKLKTLLSLIYLQRREENVQKPKIHSLT